MMGNRPSIISFFTNLQAPMPWGRKVRLLVRSNRKEQRCDLNLARRGDNH